MSGEENLFILGLMFEPTTPIQHIIYFFKPHIYDHPGRKIQHAPQDEIQ